MKATAPGKQPSTAPPEPGAAPLRNWMDRRLDFAQAAPLRRSYVVASSYRCGSTFLCSELWRTGVLGAPAEYMNIGDGRRLRDLMANRLDAVSPEDYVAKLLACRTSRNGVFGMKVHFHHFEPALAWCPSLLERLAPLTYIYLNRRDKVAQAVSMAKAMQNGVWTSMDPAPAVTLRYDEELIVKCLEELQQQRLGWLRWFEINNITPFVINYEDFLSDRPLIVRRIVELLDAEGDEPEPVGLPPPYPQGDGINAEWTSRFRAAAEQRARDRREETSPAAGWEACFSVADL
ncbi:MAG TPA: Stf0 family sulfotransferase [Stellaceae bacterium]|nr:Stf0 family sulfotransferase [Stellaceae bacterium]